MGIESKNGHWQPPRRKRNTFLTVNMNNPDIEKFNYPLPDPSWYYSGIWHCCQEAKAYIDELLTEMVRIEAATPESDATLTQSLRRAIKLLETAEKHLQSKK